MSIFSSLFKKKKVNEVLSAQNPIDTLPAELRDEFKESGIPLEQLETRADWILLLNCLFFGAKMHDMKPLPELLKEYDDFQQRARSDGSEFSIDDGSDSISSATSGRNSSPDFRAPRGSPPLSRIGEVEDDILSTKNTRELDALVRESLRPSQNDMDERIARTKSSKEPKTRTRRSKSLTSKESGVIQSKKIITGSSFSPQNESPVAAELQQISITGPGKESKSKGKRSSGSLPGSPAISRASSPKTVHKKKRYSGTAGPNLVDEWAPSPSTPGGSINSYGTPLIATVMAPSSIESNGPVTDSDLPLKTILAVEETDHRNTDNIDIGSLNRKVTTHRRHKSNQQESKDEQHNRELNTKSPKSRRSSGIHQAPTASSPETPPVDRKNSTKSKQTGTEVEQRSGSSPAMTERLSLLDKRLPELTALSNIARSPSPERGRRSSPRLAHYNGTRSRSLSPMAYQVEASLLPDATVMKVPPVILENIFTMEDVSKTYKLVSKLGKGAFGNVYIAKDKKVKSEKRFAIKKCDVSSKKRLLTLCREIKNLKASSHPNVIEYVQSYMQKETAWIVMEYCNAGTIRDLRCSVDLDESHIAFIMKQIIQGLAYLHSIGIMHRDLKGENILINDTGEIKIADLGLATTAEEDQVRIAGSKYWMAPEMILAAGYGPKADIYSLGCICYELADGLPPYAKYHAIRALFTAAKYGAPPLRHAESWSEDFKDFVASCVGPNPNDRPSCLDLVDHPFLTKACSQDEFAHFVRQSLLYKMAEDWNFS